MLIFTFRPEFVTPWGGKSYCSQMTVNRLSKGDHLKADEFLSKAIEVLEQCGADGWVGKYKKLAAHI
jgi:hypothetical protein